MKKEQINNLINSKVKEHKKEIQLSEEEMKIQRKKVSEIKDKENKSNNMLTEASKLAILKDKIMFHKACITCLEDLKKEIKNVS